MGSNVHVLAHGSAVAAAAAGLARRDRVAVSGAVGDIATIAGIAALLDEALPDSRPGAASAMVATGRPVPAS